MEKDKQGHFIVGLLVSLVIGYFSIIAGLVTVFIIAAGKEIYDYFHQDKHTPEILDFIYTVFGGIIGSIIILLARTA